MDEDIDYLAKMRSTYAALERWQTRIAAGYRPEAGSSLAADDEFLRWSPASQYAWFGLCSALDHLNAIRALVEARELSTVAQPTLARGALVGASQAVWILEPEVSAERSRRGAVMARESYWRHAQFTGGLAHANGELTVRQAELHLLSRVEELKAVGVTGGPVVTDIVERAADVTFRARYPELLAEVLAVWRQTSGAAHGLPWSMLGKHGAAQQSDPDDQGVAVFTVGGELEDVVPLYMCAYWIAVKGWELLDHRGTA